MNPYFDTSHLAGALLLVPVLAWGVMEASHLDNRREGAARVGGAGRRMAVWPFLIAASAVLYLAPHLVPAAAIRPGARVRHRAGDPAHRARAAWMVDQDAGCVLHRLGEGERRPAGDHRRRTGCCATRATPGSCWS